MALITCPECGKEISDKALQCPMCGYPLTSNDVQMSADNQALRKERLYRIIGLIFSTSYIIGLFIPVYSSRIGYKSLSVLGIIQNEISNNGGAVWLYVFAIGIVTPIIGGFVLFVFKMYSKAFGFNVYATIAAIYLFVGAYKYENSTYAPAFGTYLIILSAVVITICCYMLKKNKKK